ncbi:nuclear pore complex protein nup93-like protein [Plasmopara halstedii]|uniref:Nuclear pore protein n=1 Tax=Plasmopara halstedii TaxID=4781 RepID=A0A0N7L5L8_PLAHL|nr:nuclear pore complex protein nup93-like protein [Plasmopara halstedii]CEG41835.1 nuclear pore complex protein nup93-like protein [Plasmopara halstedii]|eukprot:XP_024578204.1 nuclear pore complex protein nup93-like protein [Plasmopara halstedii]
MATKDVDFQALYQSSLKLTTSFGDSGIPRLKKHLEQLDVASRTLSDQVPTSGNRKRPATDKASFLLASKGIDTEKLSKDLQHFDIASELEPETPLGETDLEGYLAHHHEMIVLTAIEEVNRRTVESTHDRMNRAMIDDFEESKQRLLEDLSGAKLLGIRNYPRVSETDEVFGTNISSFAREKRQALQNATGLGLSGASFAGQPRFQAPAITTSETPSLHMSQLQEESMLTEEMKQYCMIVKELNSCRVPNTRSHFELARQFQRMCSSNVSMSVTGSKWEAVNKCWQLVNDLLAGGDASKASAPRLAEREFEAMRHSLDESQRSLLQHHLVVGARLFLEKQFRAFVQETVQKNNLAIGGVPNLLSEIKAFVKHLHSSRYAANEGGSSTDVDNIWAIVYYCLRCGGDQEAFQLVTDVSGDFSDIDADIICALKYRVQQRSLYSDRNATPLNAFSKQFPGESDRLIGRYHRLVSSSIDAVSVVNPFERCVVNLLCFGDVNANEQRITTTLEDYLWQRLCFIQFKAVTRSDSDGSYTINKLSKSMQRFGPTHFEQPGNGNFTAFLYFEILLIAQEFEKAIKYLASKGFLLEAVHFAITLNYYGLLECTSFSMGEEDEQTVDIVRLIRQYIHGFQRSNAAEAANYVACIPDLTAKKELLSELLLDTRMFDVLAGFTNNTDGSRTRGLYDYLLKDEPDDEVKGLILLAAHKAEARGRLHDAFTLLKSAGDIEGVLVLLNSQLSSSLSASKPEREEWFREAKGFAEKWMRFPWVQTIANRHARTAAIAFQTLLNISIFLEIFEKHQYEDAIGFVDELEVVPTQTSSNLSLCVDRFVAFDESVRQNFHILMLGYMECLVRDAERLKTQISGEARRGGIAALRKKAELLVTFAGMIKLRSPSGTIERLNRMEAMIY